MIRTQVRDRRNMSLARALHARLFVSCEGRIFVVGGTFAREKLAQALARHHRPATAAEAPSPHDLGLSTCDGEWSDDLLFSIGRALNRWQKDLDAELQRRPARRRRTAQLKQEQREIDRLTTRLTSLREWRRQLREGREPAGAPYFLDPVAEAENLAAIEDITGETPLPPIVIWQARLVAWLSGDCAVRRFLTAAAGIWGAFPQDSRSVQIRKLQEVVRLWKLRSECEQGRNLCPEIRLHLKRFPPALVREGKLTSRLRKRSVAEHCDYLADRCSRLLAKDHYDRWQVVPAALAALTAVDDCDVPLPQKWLRKAAEQENFALLARNIEKIAAEIGRPGYAALLKAIDQLPDSAADFDYGQLRELLAAGTSLENAVWAFSRRVLNGLAASRFNPAMARRLSEAFEKRGFALSDYDLSQLLGNCRTKEHASLIHTWLGWIGSVSPRAITPRVRQLLDPTFEKFTQVHQRGAVERLADYLKPARRSGDVNDASPLLERLATYQQRLGRSHNLPKSLRKLLDGHERRRRECEYLLARQAAGALDRAAAMRLELLAKAEQPLRAAKIRRAAEEAFLILGTQALGVAVRSLAEKTSREFLGEIVDSLTPDQVWDFSLWIEKMTETDRLRLCELVATHARHGRNYKWHLADNRDWIDTAQGRAIDLHEWLAPEPQLQFIHGQFMEIGFGELQNVFLMGNYFHTCLSLGGMNEMSVLGNAYDANKQVVFVWATDASGRRRVVARQLIAISSRFELIGYHCYANTYDNEKYRAVTNAVTSYCSQLAARCGLELSNHGTPAPIGGHFWYDDGEREWPVIAPTTAEDAQTEVLVS